MRIPYQGEEDRGIEPQSGEGSTVLETAYATRRRPSGPPWYSTQPMV